MITKKQIKKFMEKFDMFCSYISHQRSDLQPLFFAKVRRMIKELKELKPTQ